MVSNSCFPEEITREILIRLPVRSLFQFKAVCKHWFALITDSNFIKAHSQHPSNPKLSVLLTNIAADTRFNLPLYNLSVVHGGTNGVGYRIPQFAMDQMPNPPGMSIVGSSNGLLCLFSTRWRDVFMADTSPSDYILWNPATGQYRYLPPPMNNNFYSRVWKGFGFHHRANDYKLLHIQWSRGTSYEADVYSLRTDSWKEVKDIPDFDTCSQPLVLKGIWYSVARKRGRSSLLKFDMGDDAFSMMKSALPCEKSPDSPLVELNLMVYKESLAIFLRYRMAPGSEAKFDMWVMKDECWTHIYKGCALPFPTIASHMLWLLGTRNDELIFFDKFRNINRFNHHPLDDLSLCLFNPSTQQSNNLVVGKAGYYFYELAHDYVESMVSVYSTNQSVPKALWLAPSRHWIKWNINGFALGKQGPAGIGGVLRNSDGVFLCIFSCAIGVADSNWAEVKAIEKALELSRGHDNWPNAKIIVESDSLNAVAWMNRVMEIPSKMWRVYDRIQMLLFENFGEVIVQHTRPGGNSVAESLAKQATCRTNDLVAWL